MDRFSISRRRALGGIGFAALIAATSQRGSARQDGYPDGLPVTLVAPAAPGSGWDLTVRGLAETLQREGLIEVPVTVVNQPGGAGAVSLTELVTQYRGDPTRISVTSLALMINELRGDAAYGYRDVTMLARLKIEYFLVVVPAASPHTDLADLLAAIVDNATGVPIAASADDRLPFGLLVRAAGGDPRTISFIAREGGGEQIAALREGGVAAAIAGVSEFRALVETGELRGLAVLRAGRLPAPLADVPTASEQGFDVSLANWRGLMGSPEMPEEAIAYWREIIARAVGTETWGTIATRNQWETAFLAGDEFRHYLDETYATVQTAIEETGEGS